MSWDRRRLLAAGGPALLCSLLLVGCGFQPLYGGGEDPAIADALAGIKVDAIADRVGQIMAIALRDGFNPTGARAATRYRLRVTVQTSYGDYAIRRDGTASRELYSASATFDLRDAAGTSVLRGSVTSGNSYDIGGDPYSSIVARDDAQGKAAEELAREIRQRVAVFMRRQITAS